MPALRRPSYDTRAAVCAKLAPPPRRVKITHEMPADLSFEDPAHFLHFVSSLTSPAQLLTVKSFHLQFLFEYDSRQQPLHNNLILGLSVLLRFLHNLRELTLNWGNVPSHVLKGTSFRLHLFESWMVIDETTIAFLEHQSDIRVLELREWGTHFAGSQMAYSPFPSSSRGYKVAPPALSANALPNLAEFSGHVEVAAQIVPNRPVQVVNLTDGFELGASPYSWEDVMGRLAESSRWIGTLSIATVDVFSLDMLAAIGRHCQALESLYIRVGQPPMISNVLEWDQWGKHLGSLVELEHIEIEIDEDWHKTSAHAQSYALPMIHHIRQWHRACPLLVSVSVSVFGGEPLSRWEWKNLEWADRTRTK